VGRVSVKGVDGGAAPRLYMDMYMFNGGGGRWRRRRD
jgi:hypothetical protein